MQITMLPLRTQRLGQQGQAMMPYPANDAQSLTNKISQQAAILEQGKDALSTSWWSTNWPIVAVGLGALGVMGYHLIYKQQ